jgi:lysophospholipase L1-like esterase
MVISSLRAAQIVLCVGLCWFPDLHAQPAALTAVAVAPDDPRLLWTGQYDNHDPLHPRFGYPGLALTFRFRGASAGIEVATDSENSALSVLVDHGEPRLIVLSKGTNHVALASGLDDGPHTIEVIKRTETWQGVLTFSGLELPPSATLLPPPLLPRRRLMFIGDSVTCGANADANLQCKPDPARPGSDAYHAYGMELGRRLDAQVHLVCYGGRGLTRDYRGLGVAQGILNAPQFFDLSIPTDDPSARAPWSTSAWAPDAIVISLGTNDMGKQKTAPLNGADWVAEYVAFLGKVRHDYPHAEIFLTEGAISTDPILRQYVQQAAAGSRDGHVHYMAAQHYPGNGCNGHPTREQHMHIADDMEPVLREALSW